MPDKKGVIGIPKQQPRLDSTLLGAVKDVAVGRLGGVQPDNAKIIIKPATPLPAAPQAVKKVVKVDPVEFDYRSYLANELKKAQAEPRQGGVATNKTWLDKANSIEKSILSGTGSGLKWAGNKLGSGIGSLAGGAYNAAEAGVNKLADAGEKIAAAERIAGRGIGNALSAGTTGIVKAGAFGVDKLADAGEKIAAGERAVGRGLSSAGKSALRGIGTGLNATVDGGVYAGGKAADLGELIASAENKTGRVALSGLKSLGSGISSGAGYLGSKALDAGEGLGKFYNKAGKAISDFNAGVGMPMAQGAKAQVAMNRAQVEGLKKAMGPVSDVVSAATDTATKPIKNYLGNTKFVKDVLAKDQEARVIQAAKQRKEAEKLLEPKESKPKAKHEPKPESDIKVASVDAPKPKITKAQLISNIKSKIENIPDKNDPERKKLIARLTELV